MNHLKESSAGKSTDRAMSVGVLTGRPAEEMPGSTGDLLPDLSELLDRVRQAMRGVAQALWPSVSVVELSRQMSLVSGLSREANTSMW